MMNPHLVPSSARLVLLVLAASVCGWQAARTQEAPAPGEASASAPRSAWAPDHVRPQAHYPQRRRSIIHHYPYPYPGAYYNDEQGGFRNPGNVGRHAEYYFPGEQFQVQGDPVKVAQFGVGGYPSRSEQLAAQQVGIASNNSLQSHMDSYAMPHFGYGFGMGGYGGFW